MKYFLSDGAFIYTRALLFTWESDSSPSNFSETNGQFLISKLNEYIKDNPCSNLVVNCNHIIDLDDHAFKSVAEYVENSNLNVVFYSSDNNHSLCTYLEDYFADKAVDPESRNVSGVKFFKIKRNSSLDDSCWVELKEDAEKLERSRIEELIKKSYKLSGDCILTSTPLRASGHFNANKINSSPSGFRWVICIMVEMIHKKTTADKTKSYTIVASSLRGATIAASVREVLHYMSDVGFYIFDHFGPKHDLRRVPIKFDFQQKEKCIYIGDFLIGGTEVKLTQAYCHSLGGLLSSVFVLGKYTSNTVLGNNIEVDSIVQLGDCVSDLEYELV